MCTAPKHHTVQVYHAGYTLSLVQGVRAHTSNYTLVRAFAIFHINVCLWLFR